MNFTEIIDKIRAGETAEEVVTPEMTLLSKEVTDEEPKIEIALKNFMSILLAQSATSHSHRDEFGDPVHITPDTALRSIRVLLKKINSWVLLDVVQWGVEHPQADGETAMARLDSLTRYKVLASLHGLALQKGGKTAKLFGAKFFLWTQVWPALRDSLLSELYPAGEGSAAESPDEQCLRFILKQFEQSLSSDALGADSDLKLVWTRNFAEELRVRQQRRQQEAAERQARVLEEQQERLRAVLSGVDEATTAEDAEVGDAPASEDAEVGDAPASDDAEVGDAPASDDAEVGDAPASDEAEVGDAPASDDATR